MNVRFEILTPVLLKYQLFRDVTLFRNVGKLPTFRKSVLPGSPGTPDPQEACTMILRDSDKQQTVDTA